MRASRSPFFGRGTIRDVTAVVGSGVATAWRFCDDCVAWPDGGRDGAGSDRSLLRHLSREGNGDGNGPVFSATFGSDRRSVVSPVRRYLFACGIDHAGLMHDVDLLAPTVPYPTGDAPPVCDAVLGRSPCSISTTSG